MQRSPSYSQDDGVPRRANLVPRRTHHPPPSAQEQAWNASPQFKTSIHGSAPPRDALTGGGRIGSFWSTQYADDLELEKKVHEEQKISKSRPNRSSQVKKASPDLPRYDQENSANRANAGISKDFEINLFPDNGQFSQAEKISRTKNPPSFVAEFDTSKLSTVNGTNRNKSRENELEAEIDGLKEQLKQSNADKVEIAVKYEKLSGICRSQRQEIQELKQALAATATPSPLTKNGSRSHGSPTKTEGSVWELHQGMVVSNSSRGPESKAWNAFDSSDRKVQISPSNAHLVPGMTGSGDGDLWRFNKAPSVSRLSGSFSQGNTSQRFHGSATEKIDETQPSGWADFS